MNQRCHPDYQAPEIPGYVHWSHFSRETEHEARKRTMERFGIPSEDVLVLEFTDKRGGTYPTTYIAAKHVHLVESAYLFMDAVFQAFFRRPLL